MSSPASRADQRADDLRGFRAAPDVIRVSAGRHCLDASAAAKRHQSVAMGARGHATETSMEPPNQRHGQRGPQPLSRSLLCLGCCAVAVAVCRNWLWLVGSKLPMPLAHHTLFLLWSRQNSAADAINRRSSTGAMRVVTRQCAAARILVEAAQSRNVAQRRSLHASAVRARLCSPSVAATAVFDPNATRPTPPRVEAAFAPVVTDRLRFAHASAMDAETYRILFPHLDATAAAAATASVAAASSPAEAIASTATRPIDLVLTDPPYCLLTPRGGNADRERQASPRKKLLWEVTGAASTLRFASQAAYADFTLSWLSALRPYASEHAPWIVWTNHLGRAPIIDAVRRAAPHMRLWNEFLWLKPAAKATGEGNSSKRKQPVQHSILSYPSADAAAPATPPIAIPAPWTHMLPPPLPLSLTANELSFRAYETALVFGPGAFESSPFCHMGRSPPPNAVVCPYEDDLNAGGSAATPGVPGSAMRHPNEKPARVLLPLLHAYSAPGALVLDPFAGSSATAATALSAGRRAATIEINDVWARHMRDTLLATALRYR